MHGLSGHADPSQMESWLLGSGKVPSAVLLNHGDERAREMMSARLASAGCARVERPAAGATWSA
ncbi:MAG: MBL fold metallo-hydrolase RNA specificity domain-containing protein [bacterium]